MADFCKQCSIETFGEDCGDLAGITTPHDREQELYALVLCEGCGAIQVDEEGRCISVDCLENHNSAKGKPMHFSTYDYLMPSDAQVKQMAVVRAAAKTYGEALEAYLPDGPDKTFVIRAHRSNAMWANVAITRLPDGTPRE
jgi:hypothetical protein